MSRSQRTFSWWDREIDVAGRPIRADVRLAAHEIWEGACRRTRAILTDCADTGELMECSVTQVSRYLDRHDAPLCSRSINGLLILAFSRMLRRRAAKLNRLQCVGGTSDLSNRSVDEGWSRQVNARLDLNNIVRQLSEKSSMVLALRYAGYDWKEIAQLLGTSVAVLRNSFWREIKQVRRALGSDGFGQNQRRS